MTNFDDAAGEFLDRIDAITTDVIETSRRNAERMALQLIELEVAMGDLDGKSDRFKSILKLLKNDLAVVRLEANVALDEKHEAMMVAAKAIIDEYAVLRANANRGCDIHSLNSKEVREAVWKLTDGKCAYCDCDLEPVGSAGVSFAIDHVVPKSAGGPDNLANYVPSCAACNGAKNGTHVLEFIRRRFPNRAAQRTALTVVSDGKATA